MIGRERERATFYVVKNVRSEHFKKRKRRYKKDLNFYIEGKYNVQIKKYIYSIRINSRLDAADKR